MAEATKLPKHKKKERRERKLQTLGNIWSGHHQISGDKRKKVKMNASGERENYSKPNNKHYYQRDKHLECSPCKILRIFLKVNEGRTSTDGRDKRKIHDDP